MKNEREETLRFIIGVCLVLMLTGTVFTVLYSLVFVQQPMNQSSPNDERLFSLISPIATFLTGTLSGMLLTKKDDKKEEDKKWVKQKKLKK